MSFDVDGARRAGYSDKDIAEYLAPRRNFNIGGAREAGYSDADIVSYLMSRPAPAGRETVAPTQVTEAPAQRAPTPERGFFGGIASLAGDTGASIVTGAGSALSGIGGLGGIAGLGYDNMLSRAGRRVSEFGEGLMSPELVEKRQALSRAIQDAESQGLVGEARAALSTLASNPSLLFSMAIEQIPAFVLSGGVGRGASAIGQVAARRAAVGGGEAAEQAVLQAGQRAGQVAAVGTAAGLQGGSVAEETYQDVMRLPGETLQRSPVYQELLRSMSPDEARATIADRAAREAGLLGGGVSVATMSLMPSAEKAMFSRGVSQSAIRRALGVGTGEAVSEGIEEGGGQFAQNLAIQRRADEERSLTQGVGGAAATGAVLGGIMGGGIGALQRPPIPPSTEPGAGNLPSDLRGAIADYVANREPETPDITDRLRLVTENLPITAEQFLGSTPEAQERLVARAQRELDRQQSGENLSVLDPQGNRDRETASVRAAQSASRPSDELISGQAGSRAEAFQFEEGRGERTEGGATQAEIFRQRASELQRLTEQFPQIATMRVRDEATGNMRLLNAGERRDMGLRLLEEQGGQPSAAEATIAAAGRTYRPSLGTGAEQTAAAARRERPTEQPLSAFFPLVEGYIAQHVQQYGPSAPVSVPAFQSYVRKSTGQLMPLAQARDVLRTYNDPAPSTQKDELPATFDEAPFAAINPRAKAKPRPVERPVSPAPGQGFVLDERGVPVAPKGPNTDEAGRPVSPPEPAPSIPTDEYGFARPQQGAGGQTPQASARAAGAEQAAPQAEVEPSEAEGRLSRRVEAQDKINALYLDKLKGMGVQGRLIRNALVDALKNREMSAEQVYAAFTAADTLATLLPAGANHRIQFVKELLPTKELADAIARSGGDPTKELQGLRERPSDSALQGVITISLSPASNVMPYLTETAAHEAFHVLQDYYGKYDPQFAKLMNQSFRDDMMIGDVDPTIRRKLEQARYPNSSKSYWQVLSESLPNVIEDAKEAQAYVFAALMDASRRGVPMTGLKPAFARFVNVIKNFFSKLGSKLRGDGFQTVEEVLGRSVTQGGRRFDQMAVPTEQDFPSRGAQASARVAPPVPEISSIPALYDPAVVDATDGLKRVRSVVRAREAEAKAAKEEGREARAIEGPSAKELKQQQAEFEKRLEDAIKRVYGVDEYPEGLDGTATLIQDASRKALGQPIYESSPDTDRILSQTLAAEVIEALVHTEAAGKKNAKDWYTQNIRNAMAIASLLHPELTSDEAAQAEGFKDSAEARVVFTGAMAITSQDMDVKENAKAAEAQYRVFKARRAFDPTQSYGSKAEAISSNLKLFNTILRDRFDGDLTRMGNFLNQKFIVRELAQSMSAWGVNVSGELMDQQVYGSMVFGPKIGNGFYQNLNANFDPVTIDKWLMRTWGRITGNLIGNPELGPEQAARLMRGMNNAIDASFMRAEDFSAINAEIKRIEAIAGRPQTKKADRLTEAESEYLSSMWDLFVGEGSFDGSKGQQSALLEAMRDFGIARSRPLPFGAVQQFSFSPDMNDDQQARELDRMTKFANEILRWWNRTYLSERRAGKSNDEVLATQPLFVLAAKSIVTQQSKPKDNPGGGEFRRWVRSVIADTQNILRENGYDMTAADIQAVLWYPEKYLWKALGTRLDKELDVSYEEAFKEIARGRGKTEEAIGAVLRSVERDGRRGDEAAGRGAEQAVARADEGRGDVAARAVSESGGREVKAEELVRQTDAALQKAARNVQASARGDVITDVEVIEASGTRAKANYVLVADLKSGGYLNINLSVDDGVLKVNSLQGLNIQKNPFKYKTEGFGVYSEGVNLTYTGMKNLSRRVLEILRRNHPNINEARGIRVAGARMKAARERGDESNLESLKAGAKLRALQASARSPLAADPAFAALRDKLTGKEYDKPGIFSNALRRFTGALPGEKNSSALVRTMVNRAAPGWMLDRLAKEKGLSMKSVGLALEVALNNSGRVQMYLDHGPLGYDPKTGDVKVREDVPGLVAAIKGRLKIADKREAQSYLVALRERDLRKSGKKGFFNLTDAEINQIISKSEAAHPEWKQMAADIQRINKALLDFAVATGTLDRSKADQLGSMFYTPFYRQADEDAKQNANEVVGPRLSDSLTRVKTAFDVSLKGGENPLGDLFENMIRNADVIMKAGMKNVAMRQAAEVMEAVGLGRPSKDRVSGKTITYRVDGQDKNFEVDDPVLYTALAGAPRHVTNGIYQTMANFAGFFRDMITLAPSFMLSNLWRGKIMAYVQEGVPFYANTFDGLQQALKSSASYKAIAAQTGFGGYTYGMGERDAAAAFEREIGGLGYGPKGLWYRFTQPLQKASEATEMAERIKLYERAKAQGMTDKEAAFQAYLLAPFSRRGMGGGWAGDSVNFFVPLVPFLNAKIQGMYRLIENEKGDTQKLWTLGIPKQMLLRGLVVMAASLALAAKNMADEPDRWDEENPDIKFRYDIIYLPNDKRILLPRAFEVGSVFGALPVFLLDARRREDGRDLQKALTDLGMSTFFFNPIPAAAVPLIGAATNYDFFRARALETAGDRSKLPEERVNRSTSAVAKFIGEQAGVSPIRVQYVLEGYSGTIGSTVLAGLDSIWASLGLIPTKPAGAFGDPMSMPAIIAGLTGANRFYRSDDQTASRFVGEFYKIKEMTDQLVRSQNMATESRDLDRLAELRGDAGLPLRLRPMVNQASTQITEINKRMARIERSDMDSVSKADALRPLREQRDMVARRVVERARQIGAY